MTGIGTLQAELGRSEVELPCLSARLSPEQSDQLAAAVHSDKTVHADKKSIQ